MYARTFEPLTNNSLKDLFIERFESMILSGEFSSGETLPSERELALQLQVSRPVVHEGLLELAARGLITLRPRARAVVTDIRKEGSLSLLVSLMNYHGHALAPQVQKSILDMRLLFEVEIAARAAKEMSSEQLTEMKALIRKEEKLAKDLDHIQVSNIAELDFTFHHLLAEASGNFIYPLLMNSFKPVYIELSSIFFSDKKLISQVFEYHSALFAAIQKKNSSSAKKIMTQLLTHGSAELERILAEKKASEE